MDMPSQKDLEWVKLRVDTPDERFDETQMEKAKRKFVENPFVPIGCAATVAALSYGIYNFLHGRSQVSQYMMRARILSQGLTVVALLVGLSATMPKNKNNSLEPQKELN